MKIQGIAIATFFLLGTAYVHAQTVDEIVSKHINAIGGKRVIERIKTQVVDADLSVMGSELTSKTTIVVGVGFRNESNFNGQEIIQCITPSGGWMINPLQGMTAPEPLPEAQVKSAQSTFDLGGDLFNYQQKGSKVELAGNVNVDGVNAIKLKFTNKEGKESHFFIDPATWYVIRRESVNIVGGDTVTSVASFSNFKKTDIGFVMPFTTVTNQGFEVTINVRKVEFNKEIDPKIFAMPN